MKIVIVGCGKIGTALIESLIAEGHDVILTQDGYQFFLDDFGAGYSNFNCLLQLPFQIIKLDMNLIRMDISAEGKQRLGLVRTLTRFLHEIEMVVVAEGVETVETAKTLEEMGIDRIQGYIYAKPMDEEKLLEFYRKQ